MRRPYEFARVQFTRFRPVRGVLRTASTDSVVLHWVRRKRWHLENNQPDLWSEVGWLHKSFNLSRHRSTQRQGDKRSAEADLIASNAPLRNGSHKARQNGPKHYSGDSRGRSPLTRLSPLSFVVQRKMGPSETVGKVERQVKRTTKDGATGGRWMPNTAGKNVKRKTPPPEVVGLAERQVKTQPEQNSKKPRPFGLKERSQNYLKYDRK